MRREKLRLLTLIILRTLHSYQNHIGIELFIFEAKENLALESRSVIVSSISFKKSTLF